MGLMNFVSMLLADPAAAGQVALGAGIAILACFGAGLGMGLAVSKAVDGISRQPEAHGRIMSTLILGLAFIETTAIYGLVASILILVLS